MAKPTKMHLHDQNPNVIEDSGGRKVETLCEQYHHVPKVASIANYRQWTQQMGYTAGIFCDNCTEELSR